MYSHRSSVDRPPGKGVKLKPCTLISLQKHMLKLVGSQKNRLTYGIEIMLIYLTIFDLKSTSFNPFLHEYLC